MNRIKSWLALAFVYALPLAAVASDGGARWVASWATASKSPTIFDRPLPTLDDATLRQVVRVSLGGSRVRVWFTNESGTAPLQIGAATLALRSSGSSVAPDSLRTRCSTAYSSRSPFMVAKAASRIAAKSSRQCGLQKPTIRPR